LQKQGVTFFIVFSASPLNINLRKEASERIPYPEKEIKGDTYPMIWASDGHIYAGVGDPLWGKISFRRLWNKLFHNLVGE